jgi:serine/threonine-protein kinase
MEQGTPMAPQQAISLIIEVLQALGMAHARKIVHRDLKPDNLFVVRDAHGNLHAKLLDFGIAKVMDAAGGMGSKTRTGVLLGTPGYMSPEQIKNSKGVDPRSDLWSIGIILYEMLTCQSPFPAENEFARLTSVLTSEARPIEQIAPHLSALSPIFRRVLAKDPNHRFQTAEEMAQALGAMLRGASVAPPPVAEHSHSASIPVSFQTPQAPATMQDGAPPKAPPAAAGAPVHVSYLPQPPIATLQSPSAAGPTHISAQRPPGVPTLSSPAPSVQVIDAPYGARGGAAWWVVGVVGFVCLGVGFALGLLVAG